MTRRRATATWILVHAIGAAGATILFVGGLRLTDCKPRSPFASGNSGPFAYTRGDEYVLPALWLSLVYLLVAVIAFVWISRNDRPGTFSRWSSANLMVAVAMTFMNWVNSALQDDRDALCGQRFAVFLAVFALPYLVVIAANIGVVKYRPK